MTQRERLQALQAATAEMKEAEEAYIGEITRLFPVGTAVQWLHGPHLQSGEVLALHGFHAHFIRLHVRNFHTGNEVHVTPYAILSAAEERGVVPA